MLPYLFVPGFQPLSQAVTKTNICLVLLDVSVSNAQSAVSPNGGKPTVDQDFWDGRYRDLGWILASCSKREALLEIWPIDGNPEAIRGPVLRLTLGKPKGSRLSQKALLNDWSLRMRCAVDRALVAEVTLPNCGKQTPFAFSPDTDVFGALLRASRRLKEESGRRSLFVLSDGLQASQESQFSGPAKLEDYFQSHDLAEKERDEILRSLVAGKRIADLKGVNGCFLGVGATAARDASLSPTFIANLKSLWSAYLLKASGQGVRVEESVCDG